MNSKTITIVLGVAVAILLFVVIGLSISALTNDDSPKSQDTPSETSAEVNPALDEAFADALRKQIPTLESVPDENIGDMARNLCQYFDAEGMTNSSLVEAVTMLTREGGDIFTPSDGAFFAGASVGAYCPQHSDDLRNLANDGA